MTGASPAGPGVRATRAVAAVAGLAAATTALELAGSRTPAVPLGSLDQLMRWAEATPAPLVAVALVRLAALCGCAYLAVVLVVWTVADAAGWRWLAGLAARALPATLRCAATGGARVGLAAGVVVGAASPVTAAPGSLGDDPASATATTATATMWRLDDGGRDDRDRPRPTATMVLLTPDGAEPPGTATESPPPPELPMDPAAVRATVDTWEVEPGDSFWSIAEAVVADDATGLHAAVSDEEVGRYWARLVTANRDRLAAASHPDLLIPGQLLVLPQPTHLA